MRVPSVSPRTAPCATSPARRGGREETGTDADRYDDAADNRRAGREDRVIPDSVEPPDHDDHADVDDEQPDGNGGGVCDRQVCAPIGFGAWGGGRGVADGRDRFRRAASMPTPVDRPHAGVGRSRAGEKVAIGASRHTGRVAHDADAPGGPWPDASSGLTLA